MAPNCGHSCGVIEGLKGFQFIHVDDVARCHNTIDAVPVTLSVIKEYV